MNHVTRRQRRKAKIMVNGTGQMTVIRFIEQRAKDLPEVTDRTTGQLVDHAKNLRKLYMDGGTAAVDEYINRVHGVSLRDTGRNWLVRLAGRILVFWHRIK